MTAASPKPRPTPCGCGAPWVRRSTDPSTGRRYFRCRGCGSSAILLADGTQVSGRKLIPRCPTCAGKLRVYAKDSRNRWTYVRCTGDGCEKRYKWTSADGLVDARGLIESRRLEREEARRLRREEREANRLKAKAAKPLRPPRPPKEPKVKQARVPKEKPARAPKQAVVKPVGVPVAPKTRHLVEDLQFLRSHTADPLFM